MSERLQVAIEIGQKMKICLNSVHEHPPYFQEAWICNKKRCLLGPLHWILILLSETNRTQFTKKMWITLFITHPTTKDQKSTGLNLQTRYFCEPLYWTPTLLLKTKNQQGCIWIYEYFMSFRIYHPPYFQRRETQQQLQAQQLFSVSLSLAVH